MKRLAVLGCLVIALTACGGGRGIQAGRVTDKTFDAAHDDSYTLPICASYGKYGCAAYILIPQTTHVPDRWSVRIEACDSSGHCKHNDIGVTQQSFNSMHVGDDVDFAKGSSK